MATSSSGTPIAARITNTPRHEVRASAWPPISGANTGATPVMAISSEYLRRHRALAQVADHCPSDHHPHPLAISSISRTTISTPIDGAAAQASEATM